jgi:ferredoxin-type protein NapF
MTMRAAHSRRWFLSAGVVGTPASRLAISDACLARIGVVCEACGDACPECAIRFALRRGGPPLPSLDQDRCTGCGACVPICPVGAISLTESGA